MPFELPANRKTTDQTGGTNHKEETVLSSFSRFVATEKLSIRLTIRLFQSFFDKLGLLAAYFMCCVYFKKGFVKLLNIQSYDKRA